MFWPAVKMFDKNTTTEDFALSRKGKKYRYYASNNAPEICVATGKTIEDWDGNGRVIEFKVEGHTFCFGLSVSDFLEHLRQGTMKLLDDALYPHKCPSCGAPAYVGFVLIDCARECGG